MARGGSIHNHESASTARVLDGGVPSWLDVVECASRRRQAQQVEQVGLVQHVDALLVLLQVRARRNVDIADRNTIAAIGSDHIRTTCLRKGILAGNHWAQAWDGSVGLARSDTYQFRFLLEHVWYKARIANGD